MADLKAGTTVGGELVWHQGNFPLFPSGDELAYKTFKVYTEYNKPKAIDNDFVSKASGGEYLSSVSFKLGLTFKDKNGFDVKLGTPSANNTASTASLRIKDTFAIETEAGAPFIQFNPIADFSAPRLTVMGDILARRISDDSGRVYSPGNIPSKEVIGLGLVDNYKQVRLEYTSTQTMTGELRAPSFSITSAATRNDQAPRLDQVVTRNSIQDFGTY